MSASLPRQPGHRTDATRHIFDGPHSRHSPQLASVSQRSPSPSAEVGIDGVDEESTHALLPGPAAPTYPLKHDPHRLATWEHALRWSEAHTEGGVKVQFNRFSTDPATASTCFIAFEFPELLCNWDAILDDRSVLDGSTDTATEDDVIESRESNTVITQLTA